MKLLKWLSVLLVVFVLGAYVGYKVGGRLRVVDEFEIKAKEITFIEEVRLAQNGVRAFVVYNTNRNDAVPYLLSEHVADLEKALKHFPKSFPNDKPSYAFSRSGLIGAIVLNYGRLALLKGDKDGEEYFQKALERTAGWSPEKKYPKIVDKNSLRNYVKEKDVAGEFW